MFDRALMLYFSIHFSLFHKRIFRKLNYMVNRQKNKHELPEQTSAKITF